MPSSTFVDTALANNVASGTTLSTADTLSGQVGDLLWVGVKCENTTTGLMSVDLGANTPNLLKSNIKLVNSGNPLAGATFYKILNATATITPRFVLTIAAEFRFIYAILVRPPVGYTLVRTAGNAGQGSADSMSAGNAPALASGVAFTSFPLFNSSDLTVGSGWTEPAEFQVSSSMHAQYKLLSAPATVTGDGTSTNPIAWLAQLDVFEHVLAARPFVGSFGRRRTRYGM